MGPKPDPKKGKDKGKGGKGKVVEEIEPADPCEVVKLLEERRKKIQAETENEIDEEKKEGFLNQIRDCEERLLALQRKSDELTLKAGFYTDIFKQIEEDGVDLSAYLKSCLKQKEDELSTLKEILVVRKSQRERQTEEYKKQIEEMKAQLAELKKSLGGTNLEIAAKLKAMQDVEDEMLDFANKTRELIRQLDEKKFDNRENLYEQERSATMAVEHMRRSAAPRLKAVAEECMALARIGLKAKVKRSVHETVEANRILSKGFSEDYISFLMKQNAALLNKTEDNRRYIEILLTNKIRMMRKSRRLETVLRLLVDKMKAQDSSFYLDFRYQQSDKGIRRQILMLKETIDDQGKVNLKEIERRDTMKKKLRETHDNIDRATITSKELYKALKAAAPGLQQILAKSYGELLLQLEVLSDNEFPVPTEPDDESCPALIKPARLLIAKILEKKCKSG